MSLPITQGPGQLLYEAFASLQTLGKRSILAMLGIIIGSASVVALINIGHNATQDATAVFKDMGIDTLVVHFRANGNRNQPMPASLDLDAVRKAVPGIAHLGASAHTSNTLLFKGRTFHSQIIGSTAGLHSVMRLTLHEGRFLSAFDRDETHAVIGHQVAVRLGGPAGPLAVGDRVRINDYLFLIVGILSPQPSSMLIPIQVDESLFIPLEGLRRIDPSPQISNVVARATPGQDVERLAVDLNQALQRQLSHHRVDIQLPQQIIDGLTRQTRTFAYLLLALGGISLVGGGVGVMNVMLMNVAERRREIGVRMALGARQRDIRNLFLLEALTLTALGALGGMVVGVTAAFLYALVSGWQFSLTLAALPLGGGSTLLVGLFFGIYPALLASRLQPVKALRDE